MTLFRIAAVLACACIMMTSFTAGLAAEQASPRDESMQDAISGDVQEEEHLSDTLLCPCRPWSGCCKGHQLFDVCLSASGSFKKCLYYAPYEEYYDEDVYAGEEQSGGSDPQEPQHDVPADEDELGDISAMLQDYS